MRAASNWADIAYFDEASAEGQQILSDLVLVDRANWRRLYRHKESGILWTIDEWDKYQQAFLFRVRRVDAWATEDHSELEKALLFATRGGASEDHCHLARCDQPALQGSAFCLDHSYEHGIRR